MPRRRRRRKKTIFFRCSSFQCHRPWHATHHMKKNSTKQKPIHLVENRAKSFYLDLGRILTVEVKKTWEWFETSNTHHHPLLLPDMIFATSPSANVRKKRDKSNAEATTAVTSGAAFSDHQLLLLLLLLWWFGWQNKFFLQQNCFKLQDLCFWRNHISEPSLRNKMGFFFFFFFRHLSSSFSWRGVFFFFKLN